MKHRATIPFATALAVVVVLVVSYRLQADSLIPATLNGAVLSIEQLGEWSKWMAGIETAALGVLAALVFKDGGRPRPLSSPQRALSHAAFVFLGLALLVVSLILSSLSSMALRVHAYSADDQRDESVSIQKLEPACYKEQDNTGRLDPNPKAIKNSEGISSVCFDIHERTLFARPGLRLGFFLNTHHWFWILGLTCLGGFVLSLANGNSHREPK